MWPKTNTEFWKNKIEANVVRDKKKKIELENAGWKVITVWECELKKDKVENTLSVLCNTIKESIYSDAADIQKECLGKGKCSLNRER